MNDEEIIQSFEREDITLATIKRRAFAYTIDEILISVLFLVIYFGQIPQDASYEETINLLNGLFTYIVLLKIIYQTFFVWAYGATPGKMLVKIRVISTIDLGNPNMLYSLNRALIRIVSESLFYIGFLWALTNPKRETWHDKVARTLVIDDY
jgi:uncharacterized RDD family membrane protein YckC